MMQVQVVQHLITSTSSELSDGYSINEDGEIYCSSPIENPDLHETPGPTPPQETPTPALGRGENMFLDHLVVQASVYGWHVRGRKITFLLILEYLLHIVHRPMLPTPVTRYVKFRSQAYSRLRLQDIGAYVRKDCVILLSFPVCVTVITTSRTEK